MTVRRGINWTRGLTRIYVLLVVGWLLYWVLWIPLEGVIRWHELAAATDDPVTRAEFFQHANLPAQWSELVKEIISSPFSAVLVVLVPPLLGYGVLRLVLSTIGWLARGFRDKKPDTATT
jgi:hypothetical protein